MSATENDSPCLYVLLLIVFLYDVFHSFIVTLEKNKYENKSGQTSVL